MYLKRPHLRTTGVEMWLAELCSFSSEHLSFWIMYRSPSALQRGAGWLTLGEMGSGEFYVAKSTVGRDPIHSQLDTRGSTASTRIKEVRSVGAMGAGN